MISNGQTITAADFIATSAGAGSSGQVPKLNSSGQLDTSFLAFKGALASGTTTKDLSLTTTTTIAHGLGYTPKYLRLRAVYSSAANGASAATIASSEATVVNGTAQGWYQGLTSGSSSTGNYAREGTGFVLYPVMSTGGDGRLTGTISVDATNITITWSKSGSPTGTFDILWEAIA